MPSKKPAPKKGKKSTKAVKPPKARAGGQGKGASLECAECNGKFTAGVGLADIADQIGKKFTCPSCGALYEIISLLESRITVTILAKGETRTYGKTYDLAAEGYARPL